jgi:hypothetical protein
VDCIFKKDQRRSLFNLKFKYNKNEYIVLNNKKNVEY